MGGFFARPERLGAVGSSDGDDCACCCCGVAGVDWFSVVDGIRLMMVGAWGVRVGENAVTSCSRRRGTGFVNFGAIAGSSGKGASPGNLAGEDRVDEISGIICSVGLLKASFGGSLRL